MRYRLIPLTICLGLWAGASAAQVRLLEAGIICPRPTVGPLIEAPGTETGFIRRIEQGLSFDLMARTVPTIDNLSFGLRVAPKGGDGPLDVVIVVTHPPMGAEQVTRQEWADTLWPGETNLNLFTFEYEYEKVTGDWLFAIEVDGTPAIEVPFQVAETGAHWPVEQVCFQFLS